MNADLPRLIAALDQEYDRETGFLGRLRQQEFEPGGGDRLVGLLAQVELGEGDTVDRRLVSLLWYMPMFLDWQTRWFDPPVVEQIKTIGDRVVAELERILGYP